MATSISSRSVKEVNRIGLKAKDYRGGKTTLCAGCGHNSISERIISACFETHQGFFSAVSASLGDKY